MVLQLWKMSTIVVILCAICEGLRLKTQTDEHLRFSELIRVMKQYSTKPMGSAANVEKLQNFPFLAFQRGNNKFEGNIRVHPDDKNGHLRDIIDLLNKLFTRYVIHTGPHGYERCEKFIELKDTPTTGFSWEPDARESESLYYARVVEQFLRFQNPFRLGVRLTHEDHHADVISEELPTSGPLQGIVLLTEDFFDELKQIRGATEEPFPPKCAEAPFVTQTLMAKDTQRLIHKQLGVPGERVDGAALQSWEENPDAYNEAMTKATTSQIRSKNI
eukprot:Filipodium_phascolosomae@DN1653_c0_g1_i2.p1